MPSPMIAIDIINMILIILYKMIDISKIFNLFASTTAFVALAFIIVHIASRLLFKKIPVKLDKNSLVVLTGACMGIGKEMAL